MSALQSMTGFGSGSAQADNRVVTCDMRSVNGKSLDIRVRLPSGLEAVEAQIKKRIAQSVARGNVQVSISVDTTKAANSPVINRDLFSAIAKEGRALAIEYGLAAPTTDAILAVRGVILTEDQAQNVTSPEEQEAFAEAVIKASDAALAQLVAMRESEGKALKSILSGHLQHIAQLTEKARTDEANGQEQIHARLKAQIDQLLFLSGVDIDAQRLAAEAALLATKADIREEIDRLAAHVKAAENYLEEGGVAGKKLDFLSQEFNRETNTICSKSTSATLTATGLSLKAVNDQFREQVQNLQ
ncbi:YicC/YloC family endoribonuclease [Ahrensia marina]|uniref:Stress-induced protein n=1 Tax=Ahrensia marina TaxID=1514904 RepID=A0A0M9GP07_9HYPH|nr:YicC/YloC family endoribonuclease [Ahrensia marina]KPB02407.1 hypothetical protein SU32_03950 [Ahrensia marina]